MIKELSINKVILALLSIYFILYIETIVSVFDIWLSSNTYGHGVIIPPIFAWLIYQKKDQIKALTHEVSYIGILGVLGTSLFWFIGKLSGINVFEQLAFFLFPLFVVWSIWQIKGVKLLIFPLLFVIFAVPVGDFLIPYLQFITADISVYMLELLSIPVYRDGMFIQIPNGNFLVAEACSGIRFLISTFTIGVLFAYLNIKSYKRRILFILLCLIVPIIGNGLRAFLMILIGHLTDMQAAVGFDHLVYGWLFFSVILVILFFIGNYIAEPISDLPTKIEQSLTSNPPVKLSTKFFLILMLTLSIGPIIQYIYSAKVNDYKLSLMQKVEVENSHKQALYWQPHYKNADSMYYKKISNNGIESELFLIEYLFEDHNKELISSENILFDKEIWSLDSISNGNIVSDKVKIPYIEYRIVSLREKEKIIRVLYMIDNQISATKLSTKITQLFSKLFLKDLGGKVFIFSTSNDSEQLDKIMIEELYHIDTSQMKKII